MIRQVVIGFWILFLTGSAALSAQQESFLTRFSAESSPLSLALGGLGVSLFSRADGIFLNPALAASLKTPVLQFNLNSDTIHGEWPTQSDSKTGRSVGYELSGDQQGVRSLRLAYPWRWQELTIALCAGWQRSIPYGYSGYGRDAWLDEESDPLGTDTMAYQGKGAQDALWLGAALAYRQDWGIGIGHTLWTGSGEWWQRYDSDLDEFSSMSGRREQINGGFWTIGAFFRPADIVMLTASLQSRTRGKLIYALFDDEASAERSADDRLTASLKIPETISFGFCLGPVSRTSLHLEYCTQLWSQAALTDYPLATMYPAMEIGRDSQKNSVLFSTGLSHNLSVNRVLSCTLAASLGWEQTIFADDAGKAVVLKRIGLGVVLQIGPRLNLSLAYRSSRGDWPKSGRFETDSFFSYTFSRSTLMVGIELFPFP